MSQSAVDLFAISRHAVDPRADGAHRLVHLTAEAVTIERTVGGIRMRVGVPVKAYRDLVICLRLSSGRATLKLRHHDSELDVVIGSGAAIDVARSARAWSAVTGKAVVIEEACVRLGRPFPRLRKRAKPSRRSRFTRDRKVGDAGRLQSCFAGEREIIARS